jgi:hypothetical protein
MIRAALAVLSLGDALQVTYDRTPRVACLLQTPHGAVTL